MRGLVIEQLKQKAHDLIRAVGFTICKVFENMTFNLLVHLKGSLGLKAYAWRSPLG
jgi:hypothetical protein